MIDLKPYKDAVEARQDARITVAANIDALMQDGKTEEAFALQPELDKAEAELQQAETLYNSMTKFTEQKSDEDPARKFVPVSDEKPDHQLEGEEPDETVKTRAEFEAMSPSARMDFIKAGGKVVDEKEN